MDGLKSRSDGSQRPIWGGWDLDNLFAPVRTDTDGRFRINGIGRERIADLLIEGPGIETKYIFAMTRAGETIEVPAQDPKIMPGYTPPLRTLYGVGFDLVATPSQPIVGVVRDKDTGKPIPGVVIQSKDLAGGDWLDLRTNLFRAVTDKEGRYRITGMPRGKGNQLQASPPGDLPYLMALKEVGEMPGLEPVTVDFELKRK
jgi:hypothetical protein